MKKEHQKLAIVQACGWKRRQEGANVWYEKDGKPVAHHNTLLNDLNAMHEAEKFLTNNQSCAYWVNLQEGCKSVRGPNGSLFWASTHATAAQRAEAFLRTLNLWQPEPERRGGKDGL